MSQSLTLSRRQLLKLGGGTALGLVLPLEMFAEAGTTPPAFIPNVFVTIAPDGWVTLTVPRTEMGQGIRTTIAMALCDELDADWQRMRVLQADGDARYGEQNTVGDESLLLCWQPLRKAAATARAMLKQAGSRVLGVPVDQLRTEAAKVIAPDGRHVEYAALCQAAAAEVVPTDPPLKPTSDFKLVGKPTAGVDLHALTTGKAVYGLDVSLPGMRYAMVERSPLPGMRVKRVIDAAARKVGGVFNVFTLHGQFADTGPTLDGVVVVGSDSWSCLKAKKALRIEWDAGDSLVLPNAAMCARMTALADHGGKTVVSRGDVAAARKEAKSTLRRRYYTPYLTHAPMEPCNCTAHVTATSCTVWAPSQDPGTLRQRIADELQLPASAVTVHVTFLGGGFGRKSLHDFGLEAVRISRKIGAPVKVFWSREDDLRHGFFKTPALQELEAGMDAKGGLHFWRHHTIHTSDEPLSSGKHADDLELWDVTLGVARMPYPVPHQAYEGTQLDTPLRTSWMRGIQAYFHSFAPNCFLDEIARSSGHDPLAWRLDMLKPHRKMQFMRSSAPINWYMDTGRVAGVLERVAAMAGWGTSLPKGRGRGIAVHYMSISYVAMVAEVTVKEDRSFSVDRVFCAVDCGLVVNPDGARAQVEGAILYGLSCCLYGHIEVGEAGVMQSNFHDYPVARIHDTPVIEVDFVQTPVDPTGLGEVPVPLVAPAVVNAIADASGIRCYELPIDLRRDDAWLKA